MHEVVLADAGYNDGGEYFRGLEDEMTTLIKSWQMQQQGRKQ